MSLFQEQHGLVEPRDEGGELCSACHPFLCPSQHPKVLWDRAGENDDDHDADDDDNDGDEGGKLRSACHPLLRPSQHSKVLWDRVGEIIDKSYDQSYKSYQS